MRPTLILLCGIPGSGKTTYAQNYIEGHPGTIHLSSDNIRKEMWGDESTQGDNNVIFSRMQSRAVAGLEFGYNVIYDATNITRKDRAGIIAACPKFAKIECHIIWAPIETCIERDAARKRTVGKNVINRMLKRFQAPYFDEGIDEIKIILPNDFDSVKYSGIVMDAMKIPHDNPHHTADIYNHCKEAYIKACEFGISLELELAALWHDIGKPYTKVFVDSKGNPCETAHYYSHNNLSGWMSYGMPNATPYIAWLISTHMEPFFNSKYYNKLPAYLKIAVDKLHEADLAAH